MNTSTLNSTRAGGSSERKPFGVWPWVILGLWFVWLVALAVMSIPEWGKSKHNLIESKEKPSRRVLLNPSGTK